MKCQWCHSDNVEPTGEVRKTETRKGTLIRKKIHCNDCDNWFWHMEKKENDK